MGVVRRLEYRRSKSTCAFARTSFRKPLEEKNEESRKRQPLRKVLQRETVILSESKSRNGIWAGEALMRPPTVVGASKKSLKAKLLGVNALESVAPLSPRPRGR